MRIKLDENLPEDLAELLEIQANTGASAEDVRMIVYPSWPIDFICKWFRATSEGLIFDDKEERFIEKRSIDPTYLAICTVIRDVSYKLIAFLTIDWDSLAVQALSVVTDNRGSVFEFRVDGTAAPGNERPLVRHQFSFRATKCGNGVVKPCELLFDFIHDAPLCLGKREPRA